MYRVLLTGFLACIAAAPLLAAPELMVAPSAEIPPVRLNSSLQAMPLLEAHQYLLWARSEVLEENDPGAISALLTASRALATFETQEPGPHGKDAEYTRQRIVEYTRVMAGDPSDAVSRIDNWMNRVSHWDGGK